MDGIGDGRLHGPGHAAVHVVDVQNATANVAITGVGLLVFAGVLWLVRSQETADDVTSTRAHVRDPRVRTLAGGVIEAGLCEIVEMERLIADLEAWPGSDSDPDTAPATAQPPD